MSGGIDRTSDERDGGSLDLADSPVREREVEGSILLRSAGSRPPASWTHGLCPAAAFASLSCVSETEDQPLHSQLSDEELLAQLHVHRRETTEWAAAIVEIQRRADREHSDERFRAALELADEGVARSDPPAA